MFLIFVPWIRVGGTLDVILMSYICLRNYASCIFNKGGLYNLLSMQLVTNEGLVEVVLEYYFDLVLATNVAT